MLSVPFVAAQTNCNATICDIAGNNCRRLSLMPVEQCEALLNLYHTTNGPEWKNHAGWNVINDPRDFALVVTRDDGQVVELDLFENRLSGLFPDLTTLHSLETLNLYENQLTGPLPSLNTLNNLKVLNLRNNRLEGPLPDLSSLTQLEVLSLYDNNLCGSIPDLSALKQLKRLDLSYNQFTGAIPDLRKLPNLQQVGLKGNQLCRDSNIDYSGFEYTVNRYPLCSPNDNYPSCTLPNSPTIPPISELNQLLLTISKRGLGNGQVEVEGVACDLDCEKQYPQGTTVVLTVLPDSNSIFTGWDGACSGSISFSGGPISCQLTMDQEQNVIAIFEPKMSRNEFVLTVSKGSNGSGSITGEDIYCGNECSKQYVKDSVITLAAAPAVDSTFVGWTGACTGIDPICQVAMTQDQNVTASFNLGANNLAYLLTVNKEQDGNGQVVSAGIQCGDDCSEQYSEQSVVILTAQPAVDSTFSGWDGACIGMSPTCQITMTQNQTVTARFARLPPPTTPIQSPETVFILTVGKEGTGTGVVSGEGINCGAICTAQYAQNSTINLVATPTSGSTFTGWSGACTGTATTCQLVMNQAHTLLATFNNEVPTGQPPTPPLGADPIDLEFIGLKEIYQVGELFTLDLVEHIQTLPRSSRVDLWVAVEYPDQTFQYMTEFPLQPFSTVPQPYRRNIPSSELTTREQRYHLLYFDIPPNISGTYQFYAVYNQAGADLSKLLFTQQSDIAFASTFIRNEINPTVLTTIPSALSMTITEKIELQVDSQRNFEAILSTCDITPLGIVQISSAESSTGTGVSCYLTALQSGEATLTTTDKNGRTLETHITVR